MKAILFSLLALVVTSTSANAANERTGAFHMPIGCRLKIGTFAGGVSNGGVYLGYTCPGSSTIQMFQSILTFPGDENAVGEAICRNFGFRRAARVVTGGWGAETSVLVLTKELEIFTHEDNQRDLIRLANVKCR